MMIKKIGEIEVYECDEDIKKYTRKEREKIVNEMFKQYLGKKISYRLNEKEIRAVINEITRENFRARQHRRQASEKKRERNTRFDITMSGDYLSLVKNASYFKSMSEMKAGQNKNHTSKQVWHTFQKYILFQESLYKVIIQVREKNGRYYIHNTKLKEVERIDDQSM